MEAGESVTVKGMPQGSRDAYSIARKLWLRQEEVGQNFERVYEHELIKEASFELL